MDKVSEIFSKYPLLIVGLIAVVAFIAFRSSSGGGDSTTTLGGGVRSIPVDQGTVDIETARLSAGTQGIGTIASLLLGVHESSDSLTASLAQTGAQRDVALSQIAGELTQAQIAAATTASMRYSDNATAITKAQIDAGVAQSNNQTSKDIERARDNTNVATTVIGFVGSALGFLSHFF